MTVSRRVDGLQGGFRAKLMGIKGKIKENDR
jgi:hypothetical protein